MDHQQDYVLRTVEERRVRLVRLWFTDVLGQIKSVAISPVELDSAFEEGVQFDGSAIDGFSRVQESDVLAFPDPNSFQLMPGTDGEELTARIFCDIANLDGTPFEGDPRQVLKRNLATAADARLPVHGRTRGRVLLPAQRRPVAAAPAARQRELLRPDDLRRVLRHPAPHHPAARGHRHPGRVLVPRGRPVAARDRPALHRRPRHGRQHHGVAHDRARGGHGRRGARHVHAQADGGRAGLGHAHPPVAVAGRRQRVLRPRRRVRPVGHGQGLHRRAAASTPRRSPRSPTSSSTPTSASSPATRRPCTSRGPATTAPRWCASPCRSATRRPPAPASSTGRSILRPTRTWRSRSCSPPGSRASRRATSCRRRQRSTCSTPPRPSGAPATPACCRPTCRPRSTRWSGSDLVREALGEHIFEWFLRNKRAEWAGYRTHVSSYELQRYLKAW